MRRAPDRAFLTVTVEGAGQSPREAQRLNAEAMTAVQQRLAAARVAKDAIRTLGYDLEQEFDFVQGRACRASSWRATPSSCASTGSRASGIARRRGPGRRDVGQRRALRHQDSEMAERDALRLAAPTLAAVPWRPPRRRTPGRPNHQDRRRAGTQRAATADDDLRDEDGGCGADAGRARPDRNPVARHRHDLDDSMT